MKTIHIFLITLAIVILCIDASKLKINLNFTENNFRHRKTGQHVGDKGKKTKIH